MNKIKKRAIRYFIEQKLEEIAKPIVILSIVFIWASFFIGFLNYLESVGLIPYFIFIIFGLFAFSWLYYPIKNWLKNNWEKAIKRAKQDQK